MYRLKLVRGRSYTGIVTVSNAAPFVEVKDKETADFLVGTGRFSLVGAAEGSAKKDEPEKSPDLAGNAAAQTNAPTEVRFDRMTTKQLTDYAAENGIDLVGCNNNPDRIKRIQQVLAEGKDNDGTDGELDFGEDE